MSTFSAFRSIAVDFLRLKMRHHTHRPLPTICSGSVSSTHILYRHFHVSYPYGGWVKNNQPSKNPVVEARKNAKDKKLKEIALKLKDHEIPYRKVQVTSPEGLSDFRTLEDVLAEVERLNSGDEEGGNSFKRYHALLVANDPHPIVKIVDFKLEFRKQKAAQEKAKNNAVNRVRKEVQLTWASSEADVETKLQKMKEDLEKGFKVDLVIMPKKNVRPPRREDMQGRADDVVAHFSDVAKEWKERDYTRTTVILYLQGTSSSPSGAADEERDHKPKKQLIKEQRRQKEEERLKKKQELEARSRSNFSEENDFLTP